MEYDLLGLGVETFPPGYPQYVQISDLEPDLGSPYHAARDYQGQSSSWPAYGLRPIDRFIAEKASEQAVVFVPAGDR